jgi:SAM-dependent methyltransferase
MKSLPYRNPHLYELGLRLLHGKTLDQRYRRISEKIGAGKSVLDLGCGTGLLFTYLHACTYIGWDLNPSFIEYCRKKGLNVFQKDVRHHEEYPECDYIVFCDTLHHIVPQDECILRAAIEKAPVIAVEPWYTRRIPRCLLFAYDQLIGDSDGINSYEDRMKWNHTYDSLKEKFLRLGASHTEPMDGFLLAFFEKPIILK